MSLRELDPSVVIDNPDEYESVGITPNEYEDTLVELKESLDKLGVNPESLKYFLLAQAPWNEAAILVQDPISVEETEIDFRDLRSEITRNRYSIKRGKANYGTVVYGPAYNSALDVQRLTFGRKHQDQ